MALEHWLSQLLLHWRTQFSQLPRPYCSLKPHSYTVRLNSQMRTRAGVCIPHQNLIEINPNIIESASQLEETLVHEICHLAVARTWRRTDPHGPKWKALMHHFGFEPTRCHKLTTSQRRPHRRWAAKCECRAHQVSTLIYNRMQRGARYQCLECKAPLSLEMKTQLSPENS